MMTSEINTRKIKVGNKFIDVRRIQPSEEALKQLGPYGRKLEIVGQFAINPPDIERTYANVRIKILRELAMMTPDDRKKFSNSGPVDFIKDKTGLTKYWIYCVRCSEKVAYCWAKNEKLEGWCDLHYVCRYDRESWYGAMTVNVSPIDGHLGFECACGEDTRDFRANRALSPLMRELMVVYSMKHRKFAHPDSKFIAVALK